MKVHQEVRIIGRVQGVGFRFFVRRQAQKLGLNGFVENCSDGAVYAEFEGEQEKVKMMIERLRGGPILAQVEEIDARQNKLKNYQSFEIRR